MPAFRLRGVLPGLMLVALLSGCSNNLMMEQFIPWYSSLIQKSIDFSSYLPVEYRNNTIAIRCVNGPDAADPANANKSWILFYQNRSPEASEVVVLNPDYSVAFQTTSVVVNENPGTWLIDAKGRILLGGLMIIPPASAGAVWSQDYSPNAYQNLAKGVVATVPGPAVGTFRHYRIDFRYDSATDNLYFGQQYAPYEIFGSDQTWSSNGSVPGQLIIPAFGASYFAKLFSGNTWAPGTSLYDLTCRWSQVDATGQRLYLFCTARFQSISPVFVLSIPRTYLENVLPGEVSVTILETGQGANSNQTGSEYDIYGYQGVTHAGGGFLSSLPAFYGTNGGGQRKPLVYNKADGTVARRVEFNQPNYHSSSGTNLGSNSSSIGQQAFLIPDAGVWLAIDGFTQKLYVCSPWWE